MKKQDHQYSQPDHRLPSAVVLLLVPSALKVVSEVVRCPRKVECFVKLVFVVLVRPRRRRELFVEMLAVNLMLELSS